MAKHLRGNPNVMGMEIPFNEPHDAFMAVEKNWRHITNLCAQAVGEGDPDRMTFTLGPSYSHNNLLPSVTWMPADRATGAAPHFYQANGPVPVRPDAKTFRSPWLARDVAATLGWSFPAVTMPLSAVDYPFYNGEAGLHGHDSLLAMYEKPQAAAMLIEAQLFQEYATGMAGHLEWTLWGNEKDFDPYVDLYRTQLTRYGPVYEAGPIDRMKAEVAFIQHPEAARSGNGHNFACVPLAKAALDLHLGHVHYLTDDQFRYQVSAELSVGLEQVVEAAGTVNYKAIVVDKRQLDPRVQASLESMKVPVLWIENTDELTTDKFAAFLKEAKVVFDDRTPKEIQLAEGPEHLLVYRRLDGGVNPGKIFPQLKRTGAIQLTDEAGKVVFDGDAAALAQQGMSIDLPLYKSAIFKITAK
jgi:hypothetical protein